MKTSTIAIGAGVVGVGVIAYYWWTSKKGQTSKAEVYQQSGGSTVPPSTQSGDGPLSGFLDPILSWFEGTGMNEALQQQAGEVGQQADEMGQGWVQEAGSTMSGILDNLLKAPEIVTS
jgi:hypothetical protein